MPGGAMLASGPRGTHTRRMSHPVTEQRCANCHTPLTGRFCAGCGQPVYGIAAAVLFLVAVFRPLVTFDPRTRWFRSGLGRTIGFSKLLSDEDVADLARRGISLDLFGDRFLSTATGHLSSFLILSVPIFALIVALVFVRPRRPLPHHAIFALPWSAFYLLVLAVGQLLPVGGVLSAGDLALLVVALTYLTVSLRRVYALGWAGAVVRTLVLFAAYQAILLVWLETVVMYAKRSV